MGIASEAAPTEGTSHHELSHSQTPHTIESIESMCFSVLLLHSYMWASTKPLFWFVLQSDGRRRRHIIVNYQFIEVNSKNDPCVFVCLWKRTQAQPMGNCWAVRWVEEEQMESQHCLKIGFDSTVSLFIESDEFGLTDLVSGLFLVACWSILFFGNYVGWAQLVND